MPLPVSRKIYLLSSAWEGELIQLLYFVLPVQLY